jgi:phenylacetate-CoA ligase
MLEFAETVARAGRDLSELNLKVLIVTGENLHPGQRTKLKELFNCPIANEYGMTECGIIAFECSRGNMHLMNHHLYVELIDPDNGQPVRPGERGEVVITELHGTHLPFIRYRTGDLAAAGDFPCPCGLNTPTIDKLEGRVADMIVTPEGKKVAGAILDYAFSRGVRRFRAYQREIDRLDVLIEDGPSFDAKDLEVIHAKWREFLGVRMKIEFKLVDRIPPDPGGKLRCVVPEFD